MQSSEHDSSPEAELDEAVEAILSGDARAVVTLYELTVGEVHAQARELCSDAARCVRAVQATYMGVLKNIASYDPSRSDVITWLNEGVKGYLALTGEPRSSPARSHAQSNVQVALQHLTPLHRNLVEMAFFDRLTDEQMAEHLKMPVSSVAFHLRRARARLHCELAAELFQEPLPVSA